MKNKNITKKLKDWDANIAIDKSDNENIKKKIMKNLDKPLNYSETHFSDPYFHIHKKVIYFAGIAAGLCFAFLLGTQFSAKTIPIQTARKTTNLPSMTLASLTPDELSALKRVAHEVDTLFPEGIRMITQSDDGNINIDTDPKKGLDDKGRVIIRYVVLKRDIGEKKWKRIRVSDVITAGGEPIELSGKDSGHLWVYPADKNIYTVESNLKIKANGETINLDYAGPQQLRIPQEVKTIRNQNSEYKVYQTLVRI